MHFVTHRASAANNVQPVVGQDGILRAGWLPAHSVRRTIVFRGLPGCAAVENRLLARRISTFAAQASACAFLFIFLPSLFAQTPRTEMIPMRDGVKLSTDIYLPEGTGKFPVLVCRTPYGKAGVRGDAVYLAKHGYVVLAQDVRGRFASPGDFYGFVNEGPDGYDTIEWAASQPWSDGQVGTFGASYLAWDQYFAAMLRPPHLQAMFALVGGAKFYDEYAYPGGIPNLGWPVWILKSAQTSPQANDHPDQVAHMTEWLTKTPVPWLSQSPAERASIFRGFPDHQRMYADFLAHPTFDDYWKQKGFYTAGDYRGMKDVPIFFLTGWYDYFADGVMENFRELSRIQHTMKRLLVGPWPHATGEDTCGDAYFGESAAIDQRALMADWFDHWMKNKPFKLVSSTPVRFFRMGGGDGQRTAKGKLNDGGSWLTSETFPPSDVRRTSFFLHADHRLDTAAPQTEASSHFTYDPANPVPTLGGRYGLGAWSKSCAQNGTIDRPDVLAFNSKPLDQPFEVTGPVTATLWVTADAPSADFAVKIMDVFPDGYALTLADGATRVPQPAQPKQIKVELGSFSNLFAKGHSIRVYVTSSNFPKLEPNHYPAKCTILHNSAQPSSIDLPIRPAAPVYDAPQKQTLMVPMRDGVELATDIYVPSLPGKYPVLVTRSPYNKNGERTRGEFFARHGYVFVAQDTRGRYASHGEPYPLITEGRDGYDTIEWAARQPWSNGKVATTGASYLAMDQYAAAIERPPHLLAMYAAVGGANYYQDSGYRGGIPGLGWPVWLLLSAATDPHADPAESKRMNAIVQHPEEWLAQPRDERAKIFAHFPAQLRAYNDFYAHPNFDVYWRQTGFDTSDYYTRMKDVPILFVSGWYDTFADATLENFTTLRAIQHSPKRLIMGPWPHGYGKTQCGDVNFGPAAELDELAIQLDWFDHWLKGAPLRYPDAKPIQYYEMGAGWKSSDSWPPKATEPERWYIHDEHKLSSQTAGGEATDTLTYDPKHPVQTSGARYGPECIVNQPANREGVLSSISDPLTAAKDVTGKVRVVLTITSDAPSADFTAKLIDVHPDGYAAPLLDGAVRVQNPKKPQQITIDLGTTSNRFAPGDRIRLDISTSSFPKLEPNPSPARDTIYHGAIHPSYIELSTRP